MGMVVRTNTMALNAYRQLGMNNSAVAKSLEKLSSGFRINRAGDDAAGLAISEKMKAQITGLETASSNAQDGISLIQTAEGNLTEVHSMLNRMVELSTKSANGTYQNEVDREALQSEMDQLLEEIDRISKSANFNGIKLLDGSMGLDPNITIGDAASAIKAGTTKLGGKVTFADDNHWNEGTVKTAQAPSFSINLADFKVNIDDNGTTAKDVSIELKAGSQAITFKNNAVFADGTDINSAAAIDLKQSSSTTDNTAPVEKTGSDYAALVNGKTAVIGSDVYSVAAIGGKLTFTYKGALNNDGTLKADANGDSVTDDTWTPVGDVTISYTTATEANVVSDEGRENCHITDITDPVAGGEINRGGATLTLDDSIVKNGNILKIGDTEFTFDDTVAAADATGTTIGIKGLTGDDLYKSVTEQLSKQTATIKKKDSTGAEKSYTFNIGRGSNTKSIEIEEMGEGGDITKLGSFTKADLQGAFSVKTTDTPASRTLTFKGQPTSGSQIMINDKTYTFGDGTNGTVAIGDDVAATLNNLNTALGGTATVDADAGTITLKAATVNDDAPSVIGGGLTLQIGDTADPFNKMNVAVADMSAKGLGLDGLQITTASLSSDAIDKIKTAINTVSTARADMGALQNRLEHTINNLDVAVENLSAANSRIRDTDMAKEMMNYTKMNVLVQSAQAMLAQANQQPQSVLQLLQ